MQARADAFVNFESTSKAWMWNRTSVRKAMRRCIVLGRSQPFVCGVGEAAPEHAEGGEVVAIGSSKWEPDNPWTPMSVKPWLKPGLKKPT